MTVQTINIGNVVNDGLGDDLRTAFEKVNANFADLSTQLTITAINLGLNGSDIFKQKVGQELVINNTSPDAFTRIDTDAGSVLASTHQQITLEGTYAPESYTRTKDIEVTTSGSSVKFKTILPITEILTTFDFGPAAGNFTNTTQLALASANIDFGTVLLPGRLDLDCGTLG
jgi:hypothetical protein